MTLVDTNILVDILTNNRVWRDWSVRQLEARSELGALIINEVIYAETSIGFETEADLTKHLAPFGLIRERTPSAALFLAGKAYSRYRLGGGSRTNVLPDFFIGAHAEFEGIALLTRDTRRYRSYFPRVHLIAPDA